MNYFGHMADDLTAMEMAVDMYRNLPNAPALKAALQAAFIEACVASRALRLAQQEGAPDLDAEARAREADTAMWQRAELRFAVGR